MDFIPYEGGPQTPIRPLARRFILAGLTVLAVALGAASVLPVPTSGSSARLAATLHAAGSPALGGVPPNAHRDVAPGSQLARPPARR
jgi:hypothetical protein